MKYRVALVLLLITSLFFSGCGLISSPESPEEVVKQFFDMEQQGNFGGSWELFHPEMQKLWKKEVYIQLRARILMQDLGAEAFSYEIGTPQNVDEWTSPSNRTPFHGVNVVPTEITFSSVFGNITLVQNYYLVEEAGRWYILWDAPSTEPVPPASPHPAPPPLSPATPQE